MDDRSLSDLDTINIDDILDGVPHGIAILDDQLRIVTMNRFLEGLTGFTCADSKGVYGDSIIRSNLGTRGQVFHQVFTTGETLTVEGDIINRDRRKILIQFTISPLRSHSDKIKGLIIVLEDISNLHTVMNTALFPESSTGILGHSLKMQEVFELMPLMARTDA